MRRTLRGIEPFALTLLTLLTLGGVGCGARTAGLVADRADDDPFGFRDASFEEDAAPGFDSAPRESGSFPDEGFTFDTGLVPDDGVRPDDARMTETGPVPSGCPATLPKDGTRCDSTKKLVCSYVGCDATVPDRAECAPTNQWKVSASACTPPKGCPIVEPVNGTACTAHDEYCWYDGDCLFQALATCSSTGLWAVKDRTCPAAGVCPETVPAGGTPCSTGSTMDEECTYLDGCGLYDFVDCMAASGTWATPSESTCTAPAPCPPTAPTPGAPCGSDPGLAACAYPSPCGSVDLYSCGGTWRIQKRGKCADPSCPTTPTTGSSCTSPGKDCTYPFGGGCALDCHCATEGTWSCKQECGGSSGE